MDITYEEDREKNVALARDLWDGKIDQFQHEKRYRRKDGKLIWVRNTVSLAPGTDTVPKFAMSVVEKITERKLAEEELRKSNEQLRALAAHQESVREQERTHIARELHDEIGQVLTGIKLSIELTLRKPKLTTKALQSALESTNELMKRVRDLSLDLRPAVLDDIGLLPALKWYFKRYNRQTSITVHFNHSGLDERRFAKGVETAAYRIVQEALTNVARHAKVNKVEVDIRTTEQTVRFSIQDRGVGFDPDSASPTTGGLLGMRERTILLGGYLQINSAPRGGTLLTIELPIGIACQQDQGRRLR